MTRVVAGAFGSPSAGLRASRAPQVQIAPQVIGEKAIFTKAELRLIAVCLGLFVLGLGWKAWRAHAPTTPLRIQGTIRDWPEDGFAQVVDRRGNQSETLRRDPSHSTQRREALPLARIDPNTASPEELDRLPGIGPALASRIVETRRKTAFHRPEDLLEVKGIGPAKLAKFKDCLRF